MAFVSVIICTHNPRPDAFRRVLDSLAAQTLPKAQWELLLVDNASDVRLEPRWPLSWHSNARHVREVMVAAKRPEPAALVPRPADLPPATSRLGISETTSSAAARAVASRS